MKGKVSFAYYRPNKGEMKRYYRGVMAWAPDARGGETMAVAKMPHIDLGIAAATRCRPDEQFCYAIGRRLAAARLYDVLKRLGLVDAVKWPVGPGEDPEYYKQPYQEVFNEIFMQVEPPDPLASIRRFVEKSPDHPVAREYADMLEDMERFKTFVFSLSEFREAGRQTAELLAEEIEEWKHGA